jgi:hypothetical protein
MPIAVEAVHELMAKRRKALEIALVARHGRVDRAHARAVGFHFGPVRAAEDAEEFFTAREALAHGLHVFDAVPLHFNCRRARRACAAGEREQ